jgi:hypothetical protein
MCVSVSQFVEECDDCEVFDVQVEHGGKHGDRKRVQHNFRLTGFVAVCAEQVFLYLPDLMANRFGECRVVQGYSNVQTPFEYGLTIFCHRRQRRPGIELFPTLEKESQANEKATQFRVSDN